MKKTLLYVILSFFSLTLYAQSDYDVSALRGLMIKDDKLTDSTDPSFKFLSANQSYLSVLTGTEKDASIKNEENNDSTTKHNGHEYADLGLPSGTLWATCNVGASSPEDYGDYFAWGETIKKSEYSYSTYKYRTPQGINKYTTNTNSVSIVDNKTELDVLDDAAYINWGDGWRMPSIIQMKELLDNNYTTSEWISQNGIYGRKITSKLTGENIFLPASGVIEGNSAISGITGNYWSRSLDVTEPSFAQLLCFNSESIEASFLDFRYYGQTIRPVVNNSTIITSISLSSSACELKIGESKQLTTTVQPSNATNKEVVWSSSDTNIAMVKDGLITAISRGTAIITASANDGSGISVSCTVAVIGNNNMENGHEYVDLGLPSGTLWATCNVGASSPEDYGGYYAWGETETKDYYDWSTYKWCKGDYNTMTKYCTDSRYGVVDNKTVLDPEDDVAHAKWGGNWRMPTDAELTELRENCTWTWMAQNGKKGYKVTSKSNGNSIFLPAAGCRDYSWLNNAGTRANYWSASLGESDPYDAWRVYFDSSAVGRSGYDRCYGRSVRPVWSGSVKVTGISLDKSSLSLSVGDSYMLTTTVSPSDATDKGVAWSSSNTSVVTVSTSGKVSALKAGTATITATTTDGSNLKATCSVTVNAKLVSSISLNKTTAELTTGESLTLVATVKPDDATYKDVEWSSSNSSVASVSNGKVTALAPGNAVITAKTTDGTNLSATCKITVTPVYVTSITLNKTSASLQMGESISLTTSIYPQNATNKDVVWSSSDDNVATVNKGYVTAKKPGRATITVETIDGSNLKATCSVTVNAKLASSISLNKTTAELTTGESLTLVATVKPDDATYKDVEWSSSNSSVASVSNGKVTALAPGNVVITAKTMDGSNLSATCTVKVKPVYVTSLSLDKESLELLVEETALLTASLYPDNATEKTVVWTSSDASVASVDEGFVKAEGAGVATITVKTTDGTNLSASCKVKVDKHPQTIIWDQDLSSLEQWGEFMELTATASSGLPITYRSSNENVASILPFGADLFYLNPGEAGMVELTASQPGNDYYAPVEMMKIAIVIDPNSIANIPAKQGKYTIYTMTGIKMGTYTKEEYKELIGKHKLKKGLYIINGIKVGIK